MPRSKCPDCAHLVSEHDNAGCTATYDTLALQRGFQCGCSMTKEELRG